MPQSYDPDTGEVFEEDADNDAARIARLEETVTSLTNAVSTLLDQVEAQADHADPPTPSRWSWRDAGPDSRPAMWTELHRFVDWLIERYTPRTAYTVPPCWYRHPTGVEELWAVMAAWQYAYHDTDQPTERLTVWHGSYLWPTLERLQRDTWGSCGSRHEPAPTTPRTTDSDFDDFIHNHDGHPQETHPSTPVLRPTQFSSPKNGPRNDHPRGRDRAHLLPSSPRCPEGREHAMTAPTARLTASDQATLRAAAGLLYGIGTDAWSAVDLVVPARCLSAAFAFAAAAGGTPVSAAVVEDNRDAIREAIDVVLGRIATLTSSALADSSVQVGYSLALDAQAAA